MKIRIGYIKTSIDEHITNLQKKALSSQNIDKLFIEPITIKSRRYELDKLLKFIDSSDIIIVYNLASISCSVFDLYNLMVNLIDKRIDLISLTEDVQLYNENQTITFGNVATILNYEKALFSEIQARGIKKAMGQGKKWGKARNIFADKQFVDYILSLYQSKQIKALEAEKELGIRNRSYFYRFYNNWRKQR